jgi:hypothetical protein
MLMRTNGSTKWGLVAAAVACVAVAISSGCELLVDFDRSKIPQDGGLSDGTTFADVPSAPEAAAMEAGGSEASVDGGLDSPASEGAAEGSAEAASEAGAPETGSETGSETGPTEGGGTETGAEVAPEAGPEAGMDAPLESSGDDGSGDAASE